MFKRVCLSLFLAAASVLGFAQEKPVITVLDLTVSDVSQAEMKMIIGLLSSSLFQTGFFTVIDVSQRDNVLKELQFSMSGCTDESCALEIGKMLAAEGIVVGSIGRVGTKYVLSVKLLETETGRTLSTADGIFKDLDELLDGTFPLAEKLARPYGAVASAPPARQPAQQQPAQQAARPQPAAEEPAGEPEPLAPAGGKKEPGRVNVPAIATLGGAVACLGAGGYFLAVSLPLIMAFNDAKAAYTSATGETADYDTLYTAYLDAQTAANDGNANTNFIIGASVAGAGVALGVVSAILFGSGNRAPAKTAAAGAAGAAPLVSAAFIPGPVVSTLSFRVRF